MVQRKLVGSYVWDTSALINLVNAYPTDVQIFAPIWKEVNSHLADERMISLKEVYNEVSTQKDLCLDWCKNHSNIFRSITPEMAKFLETKVRPTYEKDYWRRQNINTRPWPDPWLVAMAAVEDATLVTDEIDVNRQNKIPWVCGKLDVKCMTLFDFFRHIEVKFQTD